MTIKTALDLVLLLGVTVVSLLGEVFVDMALVIGLVVVLVVRLLVVDVPLVVGGRTSPG